MTERAHRAKTKEKVMKEKIGGSDLEIPKISHESFSIYDDSPIPFYFDEKHPDTLRTISAPHMISIMLQGFKMHYYPRKMILLISFPHTLF